MSALSLPMRRIGARVFRADVLGMILLAVFAAGALALALLPAREAANAATVTIPPGKAAALIGATSGEAATQMRAVGDQAKLINASLPFVSGPVRSARPFSASGSDLDQRRALLCLTQAVYYEAGFEPLEGRRAVAQVILNRMRHPAFPKSICGVVYQSDGRVCQFTFVCDGALYRAPAAAAWRQAEAVARAALAGYVETEVGSATHYHADYVAPRWAPLLAKVAQVGQHIFYRWPGAWGLPAAFTGHYIGEPRDPLSLRPAAPSQSQAIDQVASVTGPVTDGTVLKRAPNDVGGLLDASKGWTLHIPGPDEAGGAAAQMIASQQTQTSAPEPAQATGSAGAVVASR